MGDRPGPLALALSSCTWNCAGPPIKGPRKAGIDKAHGTPISRARGGAPYPVRISITRPTRGAAAAEGTALRAQPPIARRGGHGEGRYLQHPCRPALQCGGAGCSEGNYPRVAGPLPIPWPARGRTEAAARRPWRWALFAVTAGPKAGSSTLRVQRLQQRQLQHEFERARAHGACGCMRIWPTRTWRAGRGPRGQLLAVAGVAGLAGGSWVCSDTTSRLIGRGGKYQQGPVGSCLQLAWHLAMSVWLWLLLLFRSRVHKHVIRVYEISV